MRGGTGCASWLLLGSLFISCLTLSSQLLPILSECSQAAEESPAPAVWLRCFPGVISEPALFTLCHFGMIPLPALSAGQTTSVTISLCCASSFIHVFAHSLHSGSSFLTTNPHPWCGSFWEPVFLPISLASENVREGLALSRLFGSSL